MTFEPKNEDPEIRCPLGFTVMPKRKNNPAFMECGLPCCYPSACERLHRLGIEAGECEGMKK